MALQDPAAEAVLDHLLDLDVGGHNLTVYIASIMEGDDAPTFQRLPLADPLTKEFRTVVSEALKTWRKGRDEQQLELWPHVDGAAMQEDEFEYLDLEAHDRIRAQLDALAGPAIGHHVFMADERSVSGIRFYVIQLHKKGVGEPTYFFRTYTPKRELSRSKWFAGTLSGGHFDRIDTPTFLFDKGIDCFSVGKHMFVVQKTNFQAIFRYFEMIEEAASQTLAVIRERIPIKNFDEFAGDCRAHLQKLAKLRNIARQPYLHKIRMDDIRRVISQVGLKVSIETVGDVEMLVHDRADRWALLRLLDNDYVQALLTQELFEASSKRPLPSPPTGGPEPATRNAIHAGALSTVAKGE